MKGKEKIWCWALLMNMACSFAIYSEEPVGQSAPSDSVVKGSCPGKMCVFGDFLWWQAEANDVPFATEETIVSTNAQKKTYNLDGKWEPGFRVGAGYRFGFYDQLDLMLTYTRFEGRSDQISKTADSLGNDEAQYLRQSWISFLGPIVFSATGQWKVGLNVGDIEIGRHCKVGQHLSFRPHGGVRLAWIDFKYDANYTGAWVQTDETLATLPTSMKASSDFNAGGLRAGSQLEWSFCRNLGLFADVAASLLYGHFKVNESFHGGDTVETGYLLPLSETYKETMNGVRANFEIQLGLKGWVDFYQDRCRFSLFAGYELSEWFRVNELFQVVRTIDPTENATFSTIYSSNDIGFQGLTVRAALAF